MTTRALFLNDRQGRRFSDVLNDPHAPLDRALEFLDDADRRRRMTEAEAIHGRPALAGVVAELERLPEIDRYFEGTDAHETTRFRQAVGVAVRVVMEDLGWKGTGRKGSLGVRAKVLAGTSTPGAYQNRPGSLSRWFTKAEHYRLEPRADDIALNDGGLVAGPPPEAFGRALDRLELVGTAEEREETLAILDRGLDESREWSGRSTR